MDQKVILRSTLRPYGILKTLLLLGLEDRESSSFLEVGFTSFDAAGYSWRPLPLVEVRSTNSTKKIRNCVEPGIPSQTLNPVVV
jgi:hypothetical protein